MSGASSSRGAGKRRKGPVPREQGDPANQVNFEHLRRRVIRYEGVERIPRCRVTRIRDHPLLQFEINSKEWQKLQKLIGTELFEHKPIDWGWLGDMGDRERVEQLLGEKVRAMVDCHWEQYRELVLEFHSTFRHKEGAFGQSDAVSFSLGRMVHQLTIPQFAVASGFYTPEEVETEEFLTGLRGVFVTPRELCLGSADLARFWATISDCPFAGTNLVTAVRDPIYRYLLKVFSTTLVGRKSGENKANWIDLLILMCLVERRNINMASVLAWSFNRSRRGGNRAALDMGPYITRLAENLGVFDKYDRQYLTLGPASRFFAIRDLQLAGILTWTVPVTWEVRQGPQGQPPEGHPAHDVMQAAYPTQRQRPRQRHEIPAPQYARREAPPDPLTLESLYDRMDRGFGMVYDRLDRSDAALRHMMTQMSINVPHFFQPSVDPGQFAMPGQFGSSGQGGSAQQGGYGYGYSQGGPGYGQQGGYGYGYGQYGYDPAPEIPIYEQSEEEEESEEDED